MRIASMRLAAATRWAATALALALAACGGGGDNSATSATAPSSNTSAPGAPAASGTTATDALNRFNFRRQQSGLAPLSRNPSIDVAAQAHSDYQRLNNTISHTEDATKPGFTGATEADRLRAAGYPLPASGFAYGEVIASRPDAQGIGAADDLIGAIYHRFLVLEPMFREAGAGAGTGTSGLTYMTADFATIGLAGGLGRGTVAVYPFAGQPDVPTSVNSDQETPDPVPNQNLTGYPISVHANLTSTLAVQTFTVALRGGAALQARLLTAASDTETPGSAAAIIPLRALTPATTYDVQFSGSVDGVPVTRAWSFTTQ